MIVTSDHGEQFGERGLLGHGVSLYRREVHVPLLVIPPSRSVGRQDRQRTGQQPRDPRDGRRVGHLGTRNPFPGRSLTRFLGDSTERLPETSPVLCEVQRIETLPYGPRYPPPLARSLLS